MIVEKSKKRNTSRFFAPMLFIFVIYTLDLYCIYKFFQSKIEKSFIAKDINRSHGWYIKEKLLGVKRFTDIVFYLENLNLILKGHPHNYTNWS